MALGLDSSGDYWSCFIKGHLFVIAANRSGAKRKGALMVIRNEDVKELLLEIPEGHKHIRATIVLQDGSDITLQEATIANLVRAYITIKTHPTSANLRLTGKKLHNRKEGYAEWQLLEE